MNTGEGADSFSEIVEFNMSRQTTNYFLFLVLPLIPQIKPIPLFDNKKI